MPPAITPGPFQDLAYQEALTERLWRARPSALIRPDDPGDWPSAIGELLDAPVLLESYGPTAADKKFR
jgi:adenylosuccinate synthase